MKMRNNISSLKKNYYLDWQFLQIFFTLDFVDNIFLITVLRVNEWMAFMCLKISGIFTRVDDVFDGHFFYTHWIEEKTNKSKESM